MCSRQSGIFFLGLEKAEPDLSGRSLCVDEENWGQTGASSSSFFCSSSIEINIFSVWEVWRYKEGVCVCVCACISDISSLMLSCRSIYN